MPVAVSQVPCELSSGERCPLPTPVTVGSTVTLDLPADSALREFGLTDLARVRLAALDEDGLPTGAAPVELNGRASGSTASVVLPEDTAPGSYSLVVVQPTPSGGISVFQVEITVVAGEVPAVAPPAAAPASAAPVAVTTAAPPLVEEAQPTLPPEGVVLPTPSSDVLVAVPALGMDLPVLPLSPRNGAIDPPTLTAAHWLDPYGDPVGSAEQADNTLYLVAHSTAPASTASTR